MSDRHTCPVCGENSTTITIHDDLYICGNDDCGVLWNPQADDPDPFYPQNYAIGFCPRCESYAGEPGNDYEPTAYTCPKCGYQWYDGRLDARFLALSLGHADSTDDFPTTPDRIELYI